MFTKSTSQYLISPNQFSQTNKPDSSQNSQEHKASSLSCSTNIPI
ncbi:hypothetical protein OIU74_005446 [Salix koriyanagi]|uniref:Uncharacterized protein n=1 Tax=Salix koriyanagi TaxID=2511006 RepID=A0A9Q0UPR3_9ROSI|nr:hypothetical protein OIU74_005446 [Salix koriyanagi]